MLVKVNLQTWSCHECMACIVAPVKSLWKPRFSHSKPSTRGSSTNTIILFISTLYLHISHLLIFLFDFIFHTNLPRSLLYYQVRTLARPPPISATHPFYRKNNFQFRKQREAFPFLLQDLGWSVHRVWWRGEKEMKRTLPTTKVCILHVKGCMCVWVGPSVCSSLFRFPPSVPSALTSKPSSNALSNKPMIIISPHY